MQLQKTKLPDGPRQPLGSGWNGAGVPVQALSCFGCMPWGCWDRVLISGLHCWVVIDLGKRMLSVDLRFAVKARPGDGWWSSLVEQKWGENIGDALERARRDRDGKILLAPPNQASELSFEGPTASCPAPSVRLSVCAKTRNGSDRALQTVQSTEFSSEAATDGRFDLGSVTARGRPVTARAAAVGALALSPQQWVFELRPRSDWAGYPAGLRRDVSANFSPGVRELWKAVQKTPGLGPKPPPAPKAVAVSKRNGGIKAKPKPPAAPAVQKGVHKAAGIPKPVPMPKSPPKPATGGRGYVPRGFRLVRGKRAPKDRCSACVSYAWDQAAGAWACAVCLRILEGKAGRTKSKRPGA